MLRYIFKLIVSLSLCASLFGSDRERILRACQEFCDIRDITDDIITCEPINGGLTNENYKVSVNGVSYFVRMGRGDNKVIDTSLEKEYLANSLAASKSIAPKVIHYSPSENIIITSFIETKGTPFNLQDRENIERFCCVLRTLHQATAIFEKDEFKYGCEFAFEFDAMDTLKRYRHNLKELGIKVSAFEDKIYPCLLELHTLHSNDILRAFCHNDLHSGNILDDGEKLWLIDWEYAAMGDAYFDLATLASVEEYNDAEAIMLLSIYLGKTNIALQQVKSFLYKCALADARWGLWCYLQSRISSITYDFVSSGNTYLERALKRLEGL